MVDNLGRSSDLILPKPRKPIRRQSGVSRGALEISVAKVMRQAPGIMPIVGELVAAGMA
jgi:hypothetical protein